MRVLWLYTISTDSSAASRVQLPAFGGQVTPNS